MFARQHSDVRSTGHKLYGPTGIGVLYGKQRLLEAMPPWQGGGDMIMSVTFERTTYAPPPAKFEAGTPDISGAIALATAIDYVESFGMAAIERYEAELRSRDRVPRRQGRCRP